MLTTGISKWLVVAAAGLALFAFTPDTSQAVPDQPANKPEPKPKPKSKGKSKAKGKAKQKDTRLDQDQVYTVAYWQAKGGEHAAALATLRTAFNQDDPRIQTLMGFTLRKLGQVDEAMGYYQRVLAAHPDRTTTRQYLGEAYLQVGDVTRAREQLAEIGTRCGTACEDYQLLAAEIAKFERTAG